MDEINLAFNFPGSKLDTAVSDLINKLNELESNLNTEILTKILGENNRGTAEYIANYIYPLSEEWKMKQERKIDRDRVDEYGKRYGYADKGSLQFPMLNNILDDWDIISKTWNEERGFLRFIPIQEL